MAPAPETDNSMKKRTENKVVQAANVSAHAKNTDSDSEEVVSALEYAKRKKEEQERKNKERILKKKKGLKNYSRLIHQEAEELMKDNFKRKA